MGRPQWAKGPPGTEIPPIPTPSGVSHCRTAKTLESCASHLSCVGCFAPEPSCQPRGGVRSAALRQNYHVRHFAQALRLRRLPPAHSSAASAPASAAAAPVSRAFVGCLCACVGSRCASRRLPLRLLRRQGRLPLRLGRPPSRQAAMARFGHYEPGRCMARAEACRMPPRSTWTWTWIIGVGLWLLLLWIALEEDDCEGVCDALSEE